MDTSAEAIEIGWIDFSKEDRGKVMSVLDLLSKDETLDELGIAPIRDGFSELFFPGTSTIQTRAKYFLLVPYALLDLERSGETSPSKILDALDRIERQCAQILSHSNELGIIGRSVLKNKAWVKRTPADIYWSGLRRYGIFTNSNLSLGEYVRVSCNIKKQKQALEAQRYYHDGADESDRDDVDAGNVFSKSFWSVPTYREGWMNRLSVSLTADEARYLRERIIHSAPGSMMAHILKEKESGISRLTGFSDLQAGPVNRFPEGIRRSYWMALAMSNFIFKLRIRYNVQLSGGKNEEANKCWEEESGRLNDIAGVNIYEIFRHLHVKNPKLLSFLLDSKRYMLAGDIKALDERILRQECYLKGESRAKLCRPGELSPQTWYGGQKLDYRFPNAMRIINDIFEAEDVSRAEPDR